MTSERKIAANRENAKRSTGPRTREGKSRASSNSLRHGLAVVNFAAVGLAEKVERIAKAICKDHADPFRYEQAVIIAKSQILDSRVRAARIATIQGEGSEKAPRAGFLTGSEFPVTDAERAEENTVAVAETIGPVDQNAMNAWIATQEAQAANSSEHEIEHFLRALPELLSLERYERRALSRRKRAIRRFDALVSSDDSFD